MTALLPAGGAARRALSEAGDRVLLIDLDGNTRTGTELRERIQALAGALVARKLGGQPIGAWYRNSFAAFEAFLAIEWIGATRVAVDAEVPPAEARSIFDAAEVQLVIADEEHAATLGGDILIHDNLTSHQESPCTDEFTIDPAFPLVIYPRAVSAGELFGVTTSYGNWDAIMRINCELYNSPWYGPGLAENECALTMQQLMHGTGMVSSFPFLLMGLPQVVMPKFDGAAALEAIHRHQVTATFGVPGMLTRLADAKGDGPAELPLRHTLYGGAPLSIDELRRVRRNLGDSLIQLYGRFEAGWPLAVLGQNEHTAILEGDDELASSCGKFIPQIETRFGEAPRTPQGHGELQTRNPMVSPQYADAAGWCALGDVAYLDERGYLHLAGRLDGMINTGSYHVYPQQVLEAIETIPGVAQAKVTGEKDPVWGQAVTAYIVATDPSQWDQLLTRLKSELPEKLARYKIPKTFRQVKRLPD